MTEFARYLARLNPGGHDKIVKIAAILRRQEHALFGAHARNAHVPHSPRATLDIDFLVPDEAAADSVAGAIKAGVSNVRVTQNRFGTVRVFNLAGQREKLADIVPACDPIDIAAIATASPMPVPSFGTLRVPPKEVIAAMKLESAGDQRRDPLRADQDEADVGFMLETGFDKGALKAALALVASCAKAPYQRVLKRIGRKRKYKQNPRWDF